MTDQRGGASPAIAAGGAVAAAVVWLLVWLHQTQSHGRTSVNEMRLVWGLTWMDAAKALPFTLLLLVPAVEVVRRAEPPRGRMLARTAQGLLALAAVAGAVDFWTFPLGSYAETFESRGDSFPFQPLACVLAGVVIAVLAVVRRHAEDGEWAALLVLASGVVVSAVWTPVMLWPALGWAVFAGWLWWSARRRTRSLSQLA